MSSRVVRAAAVLALVTALGACGPVQVGPTSSARITAPSAAAVSPAGTSVPSAGSSLGPGSSGGPSASPGASGAPGASASGGPSASAAPSAGLTVLPCKLDTTRAEVCQQGVVGVTTQVSAGTRVFINITVKNTLTTPSAPISMLVTAPSVASVLLTGVLGLKGCSTGCTHRTNTVTGSYEAQWPAIAPGATVTFTINLISTGPVGDVRTVMRLYAETMDDLEANALLPSDPALIGEWNGIDTVITP